MMKKKVRENLAVMLVGVLALSVFTLPNAEAANAVDTEARCSVEFAVDTSGFEELSSVKVPVNLYKIAAIDVSGGYLAEAGFETVELGSVEYTNNDATAAQWKERADKAAKLITDDTVAAKSVTVVDGQAAVDDLDTGLYLVLAKETTSDHYIYNFEPYLISLPSNYYYKTGDDTWIYDLTGENAIGLKPEEKERFGDLRITKTLENQNITSGEKATFVFQVDITTFKGKQESKLVTLTFDKYGSKDAVLTHIPAGASVKVTEIYSGASYEATTPTEAITTIVADDEVGVVFSNTHNDIPNGGYGVINHYEKDENGQYQWSKLESN